MVAVPPPFFGWSTPDSTTRSPSPSIPVVGTGIVTVCPLRTRPVRAIGVGARFVPGGTTVTVTTPSSEREGFRSSETEYVSR